MKNRRFQLCIGEYIPEALCIPVTEPDILDKAILHQLLHGLPGGAHRDRCKLHLLLRTFWIMNPLWRISDIKRNKLQADRKVNEVKVKIVKP